MLRNLLSILMNFNKSNSRDCETDCVQFKLNSLIKITDHYEITDKKVRVMGRNKYTNLTYKMNPIEAIPNQCSNFDSLNHKLNMPKTTTCNNEE